MLQIVICPGRDHRGSDGGTSRMGLGFGVRFSLRAGLFGTAVNGIGSVAVTADADKSKSASRSASAAMHTPSGLAVRVAQLQAELMRATRKRLDHHGIKLHYRQVQALRLLRVCGAMSAGELARSLGHDSGGMTRLLDRLEERGLLERHAAPTAGNPPRPFASVDVLSHLPCASDHSKPASL